MRFTTRYYVIWPQLAYVRQICSPYAERRKWSEHCGYCIIWYQLSSWFKQHGVKVLSFLIQKFSLSFNLNCSVSVGVVLIFRSCSIIINLSCLPLLLTCLHASMAFGFFMSFLWLFSLILKLLSMFSIWKCLFIISFIFGSTEFYVTENCIESL